MVHLSSFIIVWSYIDITFSLKKNIVRGRKLGILEMFGTVVQYKELVILLPLVRLSPCELVARKGSTVRGLIKV